RQFGDAVDALRVALGLRGYGSGGRHDGIVIVDEYVNVNPSYFASTSVWHGSGSRKVVNCAPSSATKTAISSAISVVLALAETAWIAPGGSKNDWPTSNVSSGPPSSCDRMWPLVM